MVKSNNKHKYKKFEKHTTYIYEIIISLKKLTMHELKEFINDCF